ncbi:MAG: GTPase HflX [Lactobacillales bacterium]|jgi:GTP-binding protein HflX|nr:GTPase HflX [Lactobacillales bacterium]
MDKIREKVILVGVKTDENERSFESSMKELANLTKTADGEVVFQLTQNRPQIDRRTVIGKGKLEELVQLVDAYEADLIVFNHELTPRQNSLLEESVGVRVIDRVQLILDIFALRARSREGKLQVELAQLNYLLPRLTGQGISLSRQGGGIGARGPGETKLETDRRHIRYKISLIRKELKEVSAHRKRSREKRKTSDVFQIGLIGYTNAGKSTILNLLTSADTYEENQLFATLDPLTKKWQLPQGLMVTLTDTVGFIQDLPTQLVEAFHSTLEESQNMDLLLHVVDASAEDRLQHEQTVMDLLKDLDMEKTPVLTVYNKSDKVSSDFVPTLFPNTLISAKSTVGKEILTDAVRKKIMEIMVPYEFSVPASKGDVLNELRRTTILLTEEYREEENDYHVKGFAKEDSKWKHYGEKEE